jgi:hypothetical protein
MKNEILGPRWKNPEVGPSRVRLAAVDGREVSFVVAVKIGGREAITFLAQNDSGAGVGTAFVARRPGQNN